MSNDDGAMAAMDLAVKRHKLEILQGRREDLEAIMALSDNVKNIHEHMNLLIQTVNQQNAIISHMAAQLIQRGIIPEFRQVKEEKE